MSVAALIKELSVRHQNDIGQKFNRDNRSYQIVNQELPEALISLCDINTKKYKVYGSSGTGQWSEIFWVAILDKNITTSTQRGYYIVLLFDKLLENVYICLSLGWSQFEQEYGIKQGRLQIDATCKHYSRLLLRPESDFTNGHINLKATKSLGKGYEIGAILSRKHSINSISEDKLHQDINYLIDTYNNLRDTVGDSILNIEINPEKYDNQIQDFKKNIASATFGEITDEKIQQLINNLKNRPQQVKERLIKQIPRNPKFAKYIKQKANFVCSICGRKPFYQKNGQPYAEADHVIPLGNSGMDSPLNMRCLCAQCHAIITHGSDDEIGSLLNDTI